MRKYLPIRTYTAADLASSDLDSADYTVIMTAGIDANGNKFLLEKYINRGVDAVEVLREVIRQMRAYDCSEGIIEKNRYETLMKTCRKLVDAGFYGDRHEITKITRKIRMIPHYTNKLDRFNDSIPQEVRAHRIWMPRTWLDVKEFFLLHPAVEHDDIGDVVEMLDSNMRPPSLTANTMVTAGVLYNTLTHTAASGSSVNESLAARKYNSWTGLLDAKVSSRN